MKPVAGVGISRHKGKNDRWKNCDLANIEACPTSAFLLISVISSAK